MRQERRVFDPCHERCRILDRSMVGQGCHEVAYSTAPKKKTKSTRYSVILIKLDCRIYQEIFQSALDKNVENTLMTDCDTNQNQTWASFKTIFSCVAVQRRNLTNTVVRMSVCMSVHMNPDAM